MAEEAAAEDWENGSLCSSIAQPKSSSIESGSSPDSIRFMASSIAPVGSLPVSSNIRFISRAICLGSSSPASSCMLGAISLMSSSSLDSSRFAKGSAWSEPALSTSPLEIAKRETFFSSFLQPHFGHFALAGTCIRRDKKL